MIWLSISVHPVGGSDQDKGVEAARKEIDNPRPRCPQCKRKLHMMRTKIRCNPKDNFCTWHLPPPKYPQRKW